MGRGRTSSDGAQDVGEEGEDLCVCESGAAVCRLCRVDDLDDLGARGRRREREGEGFERLRTRGLAGQVSSRCLGGTAARVPKGLRGVS